MTGVVSVLVYGCECWDMEWSTGAVGAWIIIIRYCLIPRIISYLKQFATLTCFHLV